MRPRSVARSCNLWILHHMKLPLIHVLLFRRMLHVFRGPLEHTLIHAERVLQHRRIRHVLPLVPVDRVPHCAHESVEVDCGGGSVRAREVKHGVEELGVVDDVVLVDRAEEFEELLAVERLLAAGDDAESEREDAKRFGVGGVHELRRHYAAHHFREVHKVLALGPAHPHDFRRVLLGQFHAVHRPQVNLDVIRLQHPVHPKRLPRLQQRIHVLELVDRLP
mmetsp:Transcript_4994/g.12867  ORF Transcript_4994/g.12867 Transcript_4994/m.12867 type:complete len:221 (+) Transcript_4994:1935-2597(+)